MSGRLDAADEVRVGVEVSVPPTATSKARAGARADRCDVNTRGTVRTVSDATLHAVGQAWPPFVLVAGVLLIGAVVEADGLFAAIGARIERIGGGPVMLLAEPTRLIRARGAAPKIARVSAGKADASVPGRSREQRLRALRLANEIRSVTAQLKKDLASGKIELAQILARPPSACGRRECATSCWRHRRSAQSKPAGPPTAASLTRRRSAASHAGRCERAGQVA